MGGLLHLFNFNQAGTRRKFLTHKKNSDGLEAPRNSLELPIETSQNYHAIHENILYSYQVKQPNSNMHVHPSGNPMKKLIDEEISTQTGTKRNRPSVVARLMGMDTLPAEPRPLDKLKDCKHEASSRSLPLMGQSDYGSGHHDPLGLKPFKPVKGELLGYGRKQDSNLSKVHRKLGKPQPREHPLEEQLQKFKKEFEAWQAAKVWERSSHVELVNYPGEWRDNQVLAQQNLNHEKMIRHFGRNRNLTHELAMNERPQSIVDRDGNKIKVSQNKKTESQMNLKSRMKIDGSRKATVAECDERGSKPSKATKIVVLKPGPERVAETEESQATPSDAEDCSIEHFLEEVKERLRLELQGKGKRSTTVRGSGVETPFSERPTDPKQIARQIAKQVRENVTRDLGMNLLRSGSTRSCRSEFQHEGFHSPEFISRNTRKLLSDRLRNIIVNEASVAGPSIMMNRNHKSSISEDEVVRERPEADCTNIGKKVSLWENMKNEHHVKTRSFRHEEIGGEQFISGGISPRNLLRSLSAPVSGTSFGELLLEDPHVLTGAQIRRKLEETENVLEEVSKTRKQKFNLRGKVSNLRYSLTLRGKLFGEKISVRDSGIGVSDPFKAFMTVPTIMMNLGFAQENSTEVPPSPASVCSSPYEEFLRPVDRASPVSTLDVPLIEDQPVPEVFKEIKTNLYELRRQLNQLQSNGSEPLSRAEEDSILEYETVHLEGPAHIYIRDVLVAAGLFDGTAGLTAIDRSVFEEVEKTYRKQEKETEATSKDHNEKANHKVLFDLLNEAISAVMEPPFRRSMFFDRPLAPNRKALSGKKLLDDLWTIIRDYVYPSADRCNSLDDMVAYDLWKTHCSGMIQDEMKEIEREVALMLLTDLVQEAMKDMNSK